MVSGVRLCTHLFARIPAIFRIRSGRSSPRSSHPPSPEGRSRKWPMRKMLNAIFYLLRSGCQWRMLPHDFPRWPTVYYYFRKLRIDCTWERINQAIRERLRVSFQANQQTFSDSPVNPLPDAIHAPLSEVVVNGGPSRKVVRE